MIAVTVGKSLLLTSVTRYINVGATYTNLIWRDNMNYDIAFVGSTYTNLKRTLLMDFHDFQSGRRRAEIEVNDPEFCVETALHMFSIDPPEGAFQRGYLYGLEKER